MIMATRKRHSPELVVRKLVTADRLLAEGKDVAAVCRELAVSEQTYHRWRNQFGGLRADDAKRLKDLERENSTLKRLLADAELEKAALKEIARAAPPARNPARRRRRPARRMGGDRGAGSLPPRPTRNRGGGPRTVGRARRRREGDAPSRPDPASCAEHG